MVTLSARVLPHMLLVIQFLAWKEVHVCVFLRGAVVDTAHIFPDFSVCSDVDLCDFSLDSSLFDVL